MAPRPFEDEHEESNKGLPVTRFLRIAVTAFVFVVFFYFFLKTLIW